MRGAGKRELQYPLCGRLRPLLQTGSCHWQAAGTRRRKGCLAFRARLYLKAGEEAGTCSGRERPFSGQTPERGEGRIPSQKAGKRGALEEHD